MNIVSRAVIGCATTALLAGASLTVCLSLGRAAPTAAVRLTASDGPDGGRMLTGIIPGDTTGDDVLQAGLKGLRGQFDTAPKLLQAVRSKDGHVTVAVFRAARHSAPLCGLVIVTSAAADHARFDALFDDPKHLSQSLPSMLARLKTDTQAALEKERPAGGGTAGPDFAAFEAAAAHVALTRTAFPDGTATIGVAQGFTPVTMDGGSFSASSPDGAYANLYIPVRLLDPHSSLYQSETSLGGGRPPQIPGQIVVAYDPDPVADWKKLLAGRARERGEADPSPEITQSKPLPDAGTGFTGEMVAGTMMLHGESYVFSGLLLAHPPSADGGWMLQITMRSAPAAHAATDMPALIAMQNSERVDMNAVRDQTMRRIAAINEACSRWLTASREADQTRSERAFQTTMQQAAVAQDAIDRSSAGFIHYIEDAAVVEHDPTGARGTLDAGMADALVKSDPQNFHVVPVSQYVKGRDY